MPDERQTRGPEAIRADIEATRDDLGDTVEALSAKTDVKARAHDRVETLRADAREKQAQVKAKVRDALPGGGGDTPSDPSAPSAGEQAQAGAQQLVDRVKANPLPVVVAVAVVLGFLLGRARRA